MMIRGLKNFRLLQRLANLRATRSINTSNAARGGGGGAGAAHGHEAPKKSGLLSFLVEAEHPKLHQGYLYREMGNLQGSTNKAVGKALITVAWWWIFYYLWKTPEAFWGHMEYPDTSKWTDAELGIPPDDAE